MSAPSLSHSCTVMSVADGSTPKFSSSWLHTGLAVLRTNVDVLTPLRVMNLTYGLLFKPAAAIIPPREGTLIALRR